MALMQLSLISKSLGMCTSVSVLVPQSRPEGEFDGYPVLYLLHGMQGDHTDWIRRTNIERYAAEKNLAVIMPSVLNSGYANMAHGQKWYDYVAKELPEFMKAMLPITRDPKKTYIAGLSMGGRGSMMIGLQNPERYAAVGVLSAGRRFVRKELETGPAMPQMPRESFSLNPAFQPAPLNEAIYGSAKAKELIEIEDQLFQKVEEELKKGARMPRFFHATGTEDPLYPGVQEARAFFEAHPQIDYTYKEGPGTHNWAFWDTYIQEFLSWLLP